MALQLQIKQRRTKSAIDMVYQVLWPKERMGEAILLHKEAGQAGTGSLFLPPDTIHTLASSQMTGPLFGSDLSYDDVLENFFAWEHQAIVGTEVVNRVACQIVESRPGKRDSSPYHSVRSWVDTARLVPLRVEKYNTTGRLLRRIETTRVSTDDDHHHIPANLTVQGSRADSVTKLEGSRLKSNVTYDENEFTPAGLKDTAAPRDTR